MKFLFAQLYGTGMGGVQNKAQRIQTHFQFWGSANEYGIVRFGSIMKLGTKRYNKLIWLK